VTDTASAIAPRRYSVEEHKIPPELISSDAVEICSRLRNAGFEAYLVGGCVRDLLLGREPKDFDVSTDARPEQIKDLFRRSRIVGRRFQIVHVRCGPEIIEVTTFRGHHNHEPDNPEEEFDDVFDDDSKRTGASGILLRDNVFGTLEQDALRRDFTVNALYYDPTNQTVLDYCNGVEDLEQRLLRVIGDPDQRYQEDPVRMLRAVRFAAKLKLELHREAAAAIGRQRHMLHQVAAARLFDEVLKLLLAGYGAPTFDLLVEHDLLEFLAPDVADSLSSDASERDFIVRALGNSDRRIAEDKPVTPAFLFASLLWPALVRRQHEVAEQDELPIGAALQVAIPEIIAEQTMCTTIPKRFSMPMREIWEMQHRLVARRQPKKLASHPRFRAAYDFILLRELSGENLNGAGEWWTRYQEENPLQAIEHGSRRDGRDDRDGNNRDSAKNSGRDSGEKRDRPRRRRRRRPKTSNVNTA